MGKIILSHLVGSVIAPLLLEYNPKLLSFVVSSQTLCDFDLFEKLKRMTD